MRDDNDLMLAAYGEDSPTENHQRWGNVVRSVAKTASARVGLVKTATYRHARPFALQVRFSLDGLTYAPEWPLNEPAQIVITKSFDPKTGPATEVVNFAAVGDTFPTCSLLARGFTATFSFMSETGGATVYIQAVAAPTSNIDCADAKGSDKPAGWTDIIVHRYPADSSFATNVAAVNNRASLVIVNMSTANLFVLLGDGGVNTDPGSENATIVLPGQAAAGTQFSDYRGPFSFRFDADDSEGYALVTQGLY